MELYFYEAITKAQSDARFKLLKNRDDEVSPQAFYDVEADIQLQIVDWNVVYDTQFRTYKRENIDGKYYNVVYSRQTGERTVRNRWSSKVEIEQTGTLGGTSSTFANI